MIRTKLRLILLVLVSATTTTVVESFTIPYAKVSKPLPLSHIIRSVSTTPEKNDGDEMVPPTSVTSSSTDASTDTKEEGITRDLMTAGMLAVVGIVAYSVAAFVLGGIHDMIFGAFSSMGDGISEGADKAAGDIGMAALHGAGAVVGAVGSATIEGIKVAAPLVGKAVVGTAHVMSDVVFPFAQEASQQIGEVAAPYVQEASTQMDATIFAPMREAMDTTVVSPLQDAATEWSDTIGSVVDTTISKPIEGATESVTSTIDQTLVQPVKQIFSFKAF